MLHSELILAVLIAIVKNDEKDERNGDDQPYLGGGGSRGSKFDITMETNH